MKLENQVVSLELAKKLKKLKVEQESLFWWEWYITTEIRKETDIPPKLVYIPNKTKPRYLSNAQHYAAFTVAELGELLPTEQRNRLGFFSGRAINGWFCEVKNYGVMPYERLHVELQHKTEADARAAMLVYLVDNNLLDSKTWSV